MQISLRAAYCHLQRRHATQGVGECRVFLRRHASIRHHDRIALQVFFLLTQKLNETFATHLLFALDHKREITRQFRARLQKRFHGLEVRKMLSLVISGTPRIHRSLANGGLKRRCIPFIQRIRRLYIVMAVHQKMWTPPSALRRAGGNDGMKIRGMLAGLEANRPAVFHQPIGRGTGIAIMIGLGRHTWQPQVFAKLLFKTSPMGG